jgi:uncharacterized protein DUF2760
MHLLLAIRAFFYVLLGRPLPGEILQIAAPTAPAAPVKREEDKPTIVESKPEAGPPPEPTPPPKPGPSPEAIAVRALSIFQAEGRLFDFLFEEIDGYSDADIGAAVREIHRGCKRALQDHFKLTPVRAEAEESLITVPEGYDPAEIRLVGNVVGRPPFSGTLKHKGWRVEEVRLPHIPEGRGAQVIAPAEVELS